MESDIKDQLLDLYECRVCRQYIPLPILKCPDDHLLCNDCLLSAEQVDKCPVCGLSLSLDGRRCSALEDLAELMELLFPCKYSQCDVRVLLKDLGLHQTSCQHKPDLTQQNISENSVESTTTNSDIIWIIWI